MATIYSAPDGFEPPVIHFGKTTAKEWQEIDEKYIARLAEWCKNRNPNDPDYIGKVISFPVADGHALYMVAALKPVQLIHLELGDAWTFQYAKNLTKKDVINEVKRLEGIKELFAKHGNNN